MKLATSKSHKCEQPFDPVLFAASVPERKASEQDVRDCAEREEDAIDPRKFKTMDGMVDEL